MKKKWKTNRGGQAPTNNVCQGGTQFNISGNAQFVNGGTGIQVNGPYYATAEGGFSAQRQNGRKEKTQRKQWEPPAVRFLEKAEPEVELPKEPAKEPEVELLKEPAAETELPKEAEAELPKEPAKEDRRAASTDKVLNGLMEHGGERLDALEQIRKAMALIDPGNRVSLALLLLVCQEAKAVTIGTQPTAFVKLLSIEGLLPQDPKEQDRITHAMRRTMKDFARYISYKKWPETTEDYRRKKQMAEQLYRALLNLH